MLNELVADLTAALPPDAYPGEEPRVVVLDMLCGTVGTALTPGDVADVERATELIGLATERSLEHLQLACDLSRRMHGEGEAGRNYG